MKKLIVIGGILVAIIGVVLVSLRIYTKSFSPRDVAEYSNAGLSISIDYSRPYKNNRKIFGELVPFGETWRTGANEATIFTTSKDLKINGQLLQAGSYSLFTIPSKDSWKIVLNSETGQWGISVFDMKANKEDANDVLVTEVTAIHTDTVFEQFTINFEKMGEENELVIMWDQTLVVVPFSEV